MQLTSFLSATLLAGLAFHTVDVSGASESAMLFSMFQISQAVLQALLTYIV